MKWIYNNILFNLKEFNIWIKTNIGIVDIDI